MSLRRVLEKARKNKAAVGQFNFCTLEQYRAIIKASLETETPVILGTSESEAQFLGMDQAAALRDAARKKGVKVFLHLDHGTKFELIKEAIKSGYDSVHLDGSHLSFQENLKGSKKVVKYARKKQVFVEAELGILKGGSDEQKTPVLIQKEMTDPGQAQEFMKKTGVDSLAVCVGNVHGSYDRMPELDIERLKEIYEKTDSFLVFHGGSGFSKKSLRKVIEAGIVKVNINTSLRRVWRKSLEKKLKENPSVKPYKLLSSVQLKLEQKVKYYIDLFQG